MGSGRGSPTLGTSHFSSRESSPSSDQKPSDGEECQIDEENSYSTYLECENQLHYYEKYHEKTGLWPPETGWNPVYPPMVYEHLEKAEQGIETGHTNRGTETMPDMRSNRKRKRRIRDPYGSDKENFGTPSTRKAITLGEEELNAVALLRSAIKLSRKAVILSEEAASLTQAAVSLLGKSN